MQFGDAAPLGGGIFRLTRLLRGRLGTEHHAIGHSAGDRFVLIERDALVPVPVPTFAIGATIAADPVRLGDTCQTIVSTASIRPPSPVELIAEADGSGGLSIAWTRRSRKGWAWLDEIDAPIGEAGEMYRVTVSSAAGTIEQVVAATTTVLTAQDLVPLGNAPWTITVRQLGDHAASVPASILYPAT